MSLARPSGKKMTWRWRPRLVWREGDRVRIHALQQGVTVGREKGCDVVLTAPRVSRRHCRIEVGDDRVVLHDLGSANGTAVNGVAVAPDGRRLADGDVIDVGGVPLVFFRAQ